MEDLLIWVAVLSIGIAILVALVPLIPFILGICGVIFIWYVIGTFVVYVCDFGKRNFRDRNE
jgi:hypothetical protein